MPLVADKVKRTNLARVIETLWRHQPISRVDIAEKLSLDKSTVTKLVSVLSEKGLVNESEMRKPTQSGGRPKVYLNLNDETGVLVGLELTDRLINISVVTLSCQVVDRRLISVDRTQVELTDIASLILPAVKELEEKWGPILAIGVGMPGLVEPDTGLVRVSVAFQINAPVNLTEILRKELDYPIYCDNDANCAAWGQLMLGRRDLKDNLVYVLFSSYSHKPGVDNLGIGMGYIFNGQVFYGDDCWTGEYGLGKEPALKNHKELLQNFVAKLAAFSRFLNVHHLVLGGQVEKHFHAIEELVQEELSEFCGHETWHPNIEISTLGTQSVSAGAAAMAWKKLTTQELVLFDVL